MKNWETLDADVVRLLNKHYTKGRSGRKVEFVVVHYNAGNLTVDGCWQVWQTRQASAHYQVEDDGTIGQLVWDSDTAWHAGDWDANCRSIGIEHANRPDGTITEETLDNGAHLVAAVCKHFGLGRPQWGKNVFPHRHFQATSCPGQIYGRQKDEYMARCQRWYDAMTGAGDKPAQKPSTPPRPSTEKKTVSQLADEVIAGKWGNGSDRRSRLEAAGYDYDDVQAEVNRKLLGGGSSSTSSSSKSWKVGAKVRVTNPYDENGTRLAVSGTYTIMEIRGNRVVIGRNGVVTAACPKSNLALV